jgi:UDP-glucuronate 4-epimerase
MDLADRSNMAQLFATARFDRVIHLAAQAGVRYSLQDGDVPATYADTRALNE